MGQLPLLKKKADWFGVLIFEKLTTLFKILQILEFSFISRLDILHKNQFLYGHIQN